MLERVIEALKAKVEALDEEGVISCDHGETEEVAGRLVDAIRFLRNEDVTRDALRDAMYELYEQGWVLSPEADKAIADVVIEEMGKL